jgi:hypothetical protein
MKSRGRLVVLAPIDEDLAGPKILALDRNHELGMGPFKHLCHRLRNVFVSVYPADPLSGT